MATGKAGPLLMVPEEQACGFWVPLTLTSKLAPPIQGTVGRLCALWRAESSKRQERLMFTDISGCHSSGGDAPGLEWGKPGILLNSLLCPHPHDTEWPLLLHPLETTSEGRNEVPSQKKAPDVATSWFGKTIPSRGPRKTHSVPSTSRGLVPNSVKAFCLNLPSLDHKNSNLCTLIFKHLITQKV